ncbi:MAG: hypothetical protein ACLGIZ_05615 [Acidimicrobiia bacterium]|jgi:hypothetical protein
MRPPFKKLLQTSALMTGAIALVVSSAGVAGATEGELVESPGNSAAELSVVPNGCTVTVTSDKDISNVKLYDETGLIEEIENPSTNSFDATGATEVSAKSGTTETVMPVDCASTPPAQEPVVEPEVVEPEVVKSEATVEVECVDGSLEVLSSKDLSNVKFFDAAGDMLDELEGLSGYDNSFEIPADAVKATAKSSTTEEEIFFGDNAECEAEENGSTPPVAVIDDDEDKGDEDGAEKVTICHATGSETNPYVVITVSVNSLEEGHGAHEDDVIPAIEGVFEGSNLDMVDMVDEGCELEDEATTPIDNDDDNNVVDNDNDNDTDGEDVLGEGDTPGVEQTPGTDVEGDEVLRTVTPVIPVALPAVVPANPARPEAVRASTGNRAPQVLGSQVTRSPAALAATGAGTNLVPFGLGLVLLGFAIQRKSKALSAARVR